MSDDNRRLMYLVLKKQVPVVDDRGMILIKEDGTHKFIYIPKAAVAVVPAYPENTFTVAFTFAHELDDFEYKTSKTKTIGRAMGRRDSVFTTTDALITSQFSLMGLYKLWLAKTNPSNCKRIHASKELLIHMNQDKFRMTMLSFLSDLKGYKGDQRQEYMASFK